MICTEDYITGKNLAKRNKIIEPIEPMKNTIKYHCSFLQASKEILSRESESPVKHGIHESTASLQVDSSVI